jgi:membrane AbrB-like protein
VNRFLKTVPPLAAGLAGIFVAGFLKLPGGTFTGAMAGAAAVRLSSSRVLGPPRRLQNFARIILGVSIGTSVNRETLRVISSSLLPVTLMIAGLIGLSFLSAWAASRIWKLPFVTSLCGASPGAASAMVVLADDLDGNSPLVAVLHVLRITAIVLLMPVIMSLFQPAGAAFSAAASGAGKAGATALPEDSLMMAILLAGGIPLAAAFLAWKVPAAEILAGIVFTAVANPLFVHLESIPTEWQVFSMWIIGTAIGAQMTREAMRSIREFLVMSLVLTVVLIGIGLVLGWLLFRTTSLDLMTALIGSCPGALEAMIILAGAMGADAPMVAAMHTARLVIVMVVLPLLVRRAVRPRETETAG